MPGVVIVGAQWGDEGKGKLVDFFSTDADWVVRFQGGNNAGHTLVVNGVKTKLQLTPCGILQPRTRCLIAAGVVANPQVLCKEIATLKASGVVVSPERLLIDRDAHLVMEYHPLIDAAREKLLGIHKIGTTGRGIGPAYEDRAARCGVRFADLLSLEQLKPKVEALVTEKNKYLRHVLESDQQADLRQLWSNLEACAEVLAPFIGNGSIALDRSLKSKARVIFEGAQAALLDQCFGTIPFVTSSSTLAGMASVGCGIGPKYVDYVLGVAKAYCTRVGEGPFPTELRDQIGDGIRERGAEFGTVTGRPRRCGWFDTVALRRAARLNGFDSLALTKLDVLRGVETLRVCQEYRLRGQRLDDLPALSTDLAQVEVGFVELPGWDEDINGAKSLSELPSAARQYIEALEQLCELPISVVSVSAEREATIITGDGARLLAQFNVTQA